MKSVVVHDVRIDFGVYMENILVCVAVFLFSTEPGDVQERSQGRVRIKICTRAPLWTGVVSGAPFENG
jgi:hypothetical protein